ncbi:MAG: FHA domain-containing protein [Anaerolinea sp.]|nr:FHA domain-containing protein [Anaerolinea sp.]
MTQPQTALTIDAQEVLLYLHKTKRQIERTKQAIREACHLADPPRADAALRELLQGRYITNVNDGEYQLTTLGKDMARSFDTNRRPQVVNKIDKVEGGTVNLVGSQDITSTPLDYKSLFNSAMPAPPPPTPEHLERTLDVLPNGIPSLYNHPLRLSNALSNLPSQRRPGLILRYMLAFEVPQDALPVPVLHSDVLGRSRAADIYLRHDDYISSRHCQFAIRQENKRFVLYVEDLSSRNGTFIDNVMLEPNKPCILKHGSRLQVGNTVLLAVQIPY